MFLNVYWFSVCNFFPLFCMLMKSIKFLKVQKLSCAGMMDEPCLPHMKIVQMHRL